MHLFSEKFACRPMAYYIRQQFPDDQAMTSITTLPRGTYVPIVTPFTVDNTLDFEALAVLLERVLSAKVEGIVVHGTTGESPTVEPDEFSTLLECTIRIVAGRAVVLAGVGCNDTRTSQQQCRHAEQLGVDGLLVVCPYYNKPTQQGLYEHYQAIADSVSLPVLVYNVAGRTAVNVDVDTLQRLASVQNIVGVKESSDDIEQVSHVIQHLPDDFLVLSGCDHLNFSLMCLGGGGVISTVANLVPHKVKALVDAALENDLVTARQLHYYLQPLAEGCFVETNPIPVKTALAMMGEIKEVFRAPICVMRPDTRLQWQSTLIQHKLIERPDS